MQQSKQVDNTWVVLKNLLETEGVARQHLNSYNEFVQEGLQNIVKEINGIDIESLGNPYRITFDRIKIGKPQVNEIDGSVSSVQPLETRLRSLTYSSPLYVEMTVEEGGVRRDTQLQYIGNLPVMVKSNLCSLSKMDDETLMGSGEDPQDPGGHFIINGSERVIVGLEDLSPNRIIVDSTKVGNRAKLDITLKQDGTINVKVPSTPVDLPIVVIMRALGLETDKEIAEAISLKPELQDLLDVPLEKASETRSSKDALIFIGNRVAHGMLEEFRLRKAEIVLDWGLLPHLGKKTSDRYHKAMFIGESVSKLLELKLGWITEDDKDHYGNKVIKFAGQMLADLFRTAFRNLTRDMKYQLERMVQKRGPGVIGVAIRPGIITDKLNNSIATGNWGRGKVGVTQLLDRTNYLSTVSHLRRI